MKKKINKEKSVVFSTWSDGLTSLGQKGTFVDDFDKPEDYFEGTLFGICQGQNSSFMTRYNDWYKYFVPESTRVLEEEYKPFTKMEQLKKAGLFIGNSFFIRSKEEKEFVHLVTVTEVSLDIKGNISCIGLGVSVFSPEELLNTFEWCEYLTNSDWKPFGVKDA